MKAVIANSNHPACYYSSWRVVPFSENIWHIKDGVCLGGCVKTDTEIRLMSQEEIELKLQFLKDSPQCFGAMKYSSTDNSLDLLSLSNWERIIYEDARSIIFEFSGKFLK